MYTIHKNKDGIAKCGAKPYHRYMDLVKTDDDTKVTCKRCNGTIQRKSECAPIDKNMIGTIFHTSFGYDMTINVYVKAIEQSDKSVLVKECCANVSDDYGMGGGHATAGGLKKDGQMFRIFRKIRNYTNPYTKVTNTSEEWVGKLHSSATSWSIWDGKANYHNIWD